ncbi:MAG: hypothetical protein K0R90_837 [Oscillospiraceae bacterium]|jgi:hypothetical protein|nr:hypothetical protein [Oscillospiraceae bacterium]
MDDLVAKLQDILGSDEGKQKLKDVASMLGSGSGDSPDLSSLAGLLPGLMNQSESQSESNNKKDDDILGGLDLGGLDLNMIMKLQGMMSGFKTDNSNVQLIRALRPHIKPERQHKVDEAIKIMQLLAAMPLLQQSGILGGLLGGDKG